MDNNTTNNFQQNQQNQQYQQYQQNQNQPGYQPYQASALRLKTNRGMIKTILLSFITCGIYALVFYSSLGENINLVASRRDGKKTMHFCLLFFLVGPITCGIGTLVWNHKISQRIGDEARARGIATNFGAGTFWLWNILGTLILVGPFVYLYKLCKTMNAVCENYNLRGF